MAKQNRPTQLEKKKNLLNGIHHFAMKWSFSARVDNFSIREANQGLLIESD